MYPDFNHPKLNHFRLADSLPPNYRGMVLRAGQVTAADANQGIMVLQDIIQPEFQIHFHLYDLLKPLFIPARQEKTFLVAFLALRNSIQYFIGGLGKFQLRQGEFALLHSPEQEGILRIEKPGIYQSLEVGWSETLVQQAFPYFPGLQSGLDGKDPKHPFYLYPPGRVAGSKSLDIVREMLKAPYDGPVSLLYFEHKVREYLLSLLTEAGKTAEVRLHLTPEEKERVIVLAEKLRAGPDRKFPIAELARETGMNEMKLKMAFKELFGSGIFEYHLEIRMKEAHRLLEETGLNTKAIAAQVGYELTTSFITKFREYFGYPPSEVRRNS
ncbi:MAG TPA: AraC family transcriptional regulator [Puia sp.]